MEGLAVRHLRHFLTWAAFAAFVIPAHAQTGEACALLTDGDARLVCYDSVFRVKREEPSSPPAGDWNVQVTTSRIDDSTNVVMVLDSDDRIARPFGGSDHAQLIIRCAENTTSLYFRWADQFLADIQGYGNVTYRKDSEPAKTRSMSESTDNKALGLWNGGTSIPFIKSLFGGENLLVQITPFNQSRTTADFKIAGLDDAIEPLRNACQW